MVANSTTADKAALGDKRTRPPTPPTLTGEFRFCWLMMKRLLAALADGRQVHIKYYAISLARLLQLPAPFKDTGE